MVNLKSEIEKVILKEASPPQVSNSVCTVKINIQPSALPLKVVQHMPISTAMFETFRATFDHTKVRIPPGSNFSQVDDFIRYELSEDRVAIFHGGYLEVQEEDRAALVSIENVAFGTQTLASTVNGTTAHALHICKVLAELLWSTIGRERKWGELSDQMALVSYSTSTTVDLEKNLMDLFSKEFVHFIKLDIEAKDGFGAKMGALGQSATISPNEIRAVASAKDLRLEVSLFDEISGHQEIVNMNIVPDTQHDVNRGRVKIYSELPFDLHVEMINNLIEKIGAGN